MRLFILLPKCNAEGDSSWDWVQNTEAWTAENEAQWNSTDRLGESWRPLKLRVVPGVRACDFYSFDIHPIVTQRAWDAIQPVVRESVEALPVHLVKGGPLLLLHVLDRVPLARGSETSYDEMKEFATRIHRFAFREADLLGKTIFCVTGQRVRYDHCVVAEPFKEAVLAGGLIGAEFVEIEWHRESQGEF